MLSLIRQLRDRGHSDLAYALARTVTADNVKNAGTYYRSAHEALDDLGFHNPLRRTNKAATFLKQMKAPSLQEALPLDKANASYAATARRVMYACLSSKSRRAWASRTYASLIYAMSFRDAADLLGVSQDASPDDVKRAYKSKAFENHPDRGGDPKVMVQLNVARDILLNKQKPSRTPYRPSRPSHPPPKRPAPIFDWISFDEAARAAGVPSSGVDWKFVTTHSFGGHGARSVYGYVVYGRSSSAHVFVSVYHVRHFDIIHADIDINKYSMFVRKVPISQSLPKIAPKIIRKLWDLFHDVKPYKGKVHLFQREGVRFNEHQSQTKRTPVSFKDAMRLLGENVPGKKTVNIEVEILGKYLQFIVNGKEYVASKLQPMPRGLIVHAVFGRSFYIGARKSITRMRKGRNEVMKFILKHLRAAGESSDLIQAFEEALKGH